MLCGSAQLLGYDGGGEVSVSASVWFPSSKVPSEWLGSAVWCRALWAITRHSGLWRAAYVCLYLEQTQRFHLK